jgi:hypothetical protein
MTYDGNDREQIDVDTELVRKACTELLLHFDAVQIFANRHEPDETLSVTHYGKGNFYARYGQVVKWIKRDDMRDLTEDKPEDFD